MPGMRALLKLSFALNHEWHAGAAGFRAVNIALHAGQRRAGVHAAACDWAGGCAAGRDPRRAVLAAVAALVFALHPVQTESVTYIAGRSNVLMAQFRAAGFAGLVEGQRHTSQGRCVAEFRVPPAAVATKESAAVLPLAFLLWSVTTLIRPARKLLRAVLPAFVLAFLLLAIGLVWMPYASLLATSLAERGMFANLAVQAQAVTWLAGQLLPFAQLNADPALEFASGIVPSCPGADCAACRVGSACGVQPAPSTRGRFRSPVVLPLAGADELADCPAGSGQ